MRIDGFHSDDDVVYLHHTVVDDVSLHFGLHAEFLVAASIT